MEKLHPGVKWKFRIGTYVSGIMIMFLPFLFLPFVKNRYPELILTILSPFFGIFLLIVVVGEIYVRMAYNRWFYEFNEDGLRLERGVIWKNYGNVPYSRIQHIDIHRGIIARMLGFSTVMVQTAGFSGPQRIAEGHIPAVGVKKAEEIRKFVMKKITKEKGGKNSGL